MFTAITEGIMKAIGYLARAAKPRPVKNQRHAYEVEGIVLYLKKPMFMLTPEQREIALSKDRSTLPGTVVYPVRIHRRTLIDTTKYSGEKLRAIRATGQKRECQRRLARMRTA